MLLQEIYDTDVIGRGGSAEVTSSIEEPGTVTKKVTKGARGFNRVPFPSVRAIERDGYYEFIKMLQRSDRAASNPYLPRIYDVRIKPEPEPHLEVDMERLHKLDTISDEEARVIGNQLFDGFDRLRKAHDRRYVTLDPKEALVEFVGRAVQGSSQLMSAVQDPQFKQAVMFVKNLVRKRLSRFDVIKENLMVRRGRHVPQLVLLDPVG